MQNSFSAYSYRISSSSSTRTRFRLNLLTGCYLRATNNIELAVAVVAVLVIVVGEYCSHKYSVCPGAELRLCEGRD